MHSWVSREADTGDIAVSRVGTAPELEFLGHSFFANKLGFLLIYLPESLCLNGFEDVQRVRTLRHFQGGNFHSLIKSLIIKWMNDLGIYCNGPRNKTKG